MKYALKDVLEYIRKVRKEKFTENEIKHFKIKFKKGLKQIKIGDKK